MYTDPLCRTVVTGSVGAGPSDRVHFKYVFLEWQHYISNSKEWVQYVEYS